MKASYETRAERSETDFRFQDRPAAEERRRGLAPPGWQTLPIPFLSVDPIDRSVTEAMNSLRMQIGAGVALGKAFRTSGTLCRSTLARGAFVRAGNEVDRGASFDEALLVLSGALSFPERAVLAAGWSAGKIEPAMASVVERREVLHKTRSMVRSQMILPIILFITAMFVFRLPGLILGTMSAEEYLIRSATPIVSVAAIFFALRCFQLWLTRRHAGREMDAPPPPTTPIDILLLSVPVLALVQRWRNRSEFAGIMSGLLAAGLGMISALEVCARALPNGLYRSDASKALKRIREEGISLAEALPKGRRWPSDWIAALEVAYEAGEEDKILGRLAAQARERYLKAVHAAGIVAGRLIYLAVCLLIVYLIFQMLGPIFGAYSEVLN